MKHMMMNKLFRHLSVGRTWAKIILIRLEGFDKLIDLLGLE